MTTVPTTPPNGNPGIVPPWLTTPAAVKPLPPIKHRGSRLTDLSEPGAAPRPEVKRTDGYGALDAAWIENRRRSIRFALMRDELRRG